MSKYLQQYREQLEQAHQTFIEHPTMAHAWALASATEQYLEIERVS